MINARSVIPVIVGATGTISESFRKHRSNVTGEHDMKNMQKTAALLTERYCANYRYRSTKGVL